MNCKNCDSENELDCESKCWKCGQKLVEDSRCSAEDVPDDERDAVDWAECSGMPYSQKGYFITVDRACLTRLVRNHDYLAMKANAKAEAPADATPNTVE